MGFQFSFEVLYLFLIYGHPRMSHLKNASNMYLLLFSYSVMSDSLSSRGLQTPGFPVLHHLLELAQTQVHWICDVIQPFHLLSSLLLLPSVFPASGSFLMSQLFSSGGQSFEASVSATVLPVNIQHWFHLGWTGLISLLLKGLKSLLQHHSSKHQFFDAQAPLWSSSHIYTWLLEKP